MAPEIRAASPDELPALHEVMSIPFHFTANAESVELFSLTAEADRSRCVFEDGRMVATSGAYSLRMTVPGAVLPTSGVTWITVRPTHRRRGLLRRMMAALFEDARDRGEPLAALWASESSIYGRFGFGIAAHLCDLRIERDHGAFRRPLEAPGSLRMVEAAEARRLFPPVFEACARQRPGHFARSEAWWRRRTWDPQWERRGGTGSRYVVYEEDGEVRGYLHYRTREGWAPTGVSEGQAIVLELQGMDGTAIAALWRVVLDVDLIRHVVAENRPVDDPLPWLLADPRRAERRVRDALHLRLMDVPAALAGRAYQGEGRLVLQVSDPQCPWNEGTFELEVGGGGAQCKRSRATPELSLSVEDLGALYLGGVPIAPLALAGRVQGEPGALARAEAILRWDVAPWCPEIF